MTTSVRVRRGLLPAAVVALALGLSGCAGGLYPVRGTVTLDDGTPLTKGLVVFERVGGGTPITARGSVGPDGTYELSTAVRREVHEVRDVRAGVRGEGRAERLPDQARPAEEEIRRAKRAGSVSARVKGRRRSTDYTDDTD